MQAARPVASSNAEPVSEERRESSIEPTAKERRESSKEPTAKERRESSKEPTAKERYRYVAPSMPELELPSTQFAAAPTPATKGAPATASQGAATPSTPVSPPKGAESAPSMNMYLRQMLEGPSLELDVVPSSDAAPLSTQPYRPAVRGIRCGMEPAAAPKDEMALAQEAEKLGNFGPVPNVWWQWGLYDLRVHRRLRTLKSERTALEASCKQAYEHYEKAVVRLGQQVLEMEAPPPSSAAPISLQPVSNRPKADAPVGIRDQGPPPAERFAIEAAFRALNFPKKIPTNHPLRLEVDLRQDEMQQLRGLMERYDAAMGSYDHRIAQSGLRLYASAFAVFFLVAVVPMLVRLAIREEWLPDALAR
jgi:hypothetical protein